MKRKRNPMRKGRAGSGPMTVGELIEVLKDFDQNDFVVFTYNYGDHGRTQVAEEVRTVKEGLIEDNAYVDGFSVVDENDEENDGRVMEKVVILGN